jgi:putative N6-adenine-specific DNA methylase
MTRMYEYQEKGRFFAQTQEGIEELGAEELAALGAKNIKLGFRGIFFEADNASLYLINYTSRLISRVLAPLASFRCHNADYLYRKAKGIPWGNFFTPHHTFAIFSHVSHSNIKHSQYAGLRLKDAIADHFMEEYEQRPDIDRTNPDVWINLHIENDRAIISLDTSGGSLHRRGYREETVEAPMQEIVAASVMRLTEWDGSKPLYDPMCGSGTLLIEALMAYCRIPAGFLRKRFGFEFLPDFSEALWKKVKKEAAHGMRDLPPGLISGSDISRQAIDAAKTNAQSIPQGNKIGFRILDLQKIEDLSDRFIVCNPPYGIRLGKGEDLKFFYNELGNFLKRKCNGSTAFIYFGDRKWISDIGLKPSWKKALKSGGLDGRLAKFEMY